ncbi:MAG: patatin family protein [Coriobacteriales bacterium]|jgi:predicted patatin/cPLA2 family phospholipase|nr:patatin family protein [Coriobacteriales bacterium]
MTVEETTEQAAELGAEQEASEQDLPVEKASAQEPEQNPAQKPSGAMQSETESSGQEAPGSPYARYQPFDTPGYQPAWKDATLVEANLVLEGGAMRGCFCAGVLDFLMDEGLLPKHAIGVSAGALNGFNYVAGMRGRTCHLNTKYCNDWRYFSMRSFFQTGNAFNIPFVFDKLINEIEPFDFDAYRASPLDLVAVSSNIEAGKADYTNLTEPVEQLPYLQATSAVPLISRTVSIDDKLLLDGGICDSVPLEYSRRTGVKKHIVVLTQDAGYVKKPNQLMPLMYLRYFRHPKFIESVEQRHENYNQTYRLVDALHDAGEIFVIRPPEKVVVKNMERDASKLFALYTQGYEEAQRNFAALQKYLEL